MGKYNEYRVGLLGEYRVEQSGRTAAWLEYRKHEEFFAYILLRARTPTPVEEVASALWPDKTVPLAVNRLYETTFKIKNQLAEIGLGEDVIQTRRQGVLFPHPGLGLDVLDLNQLRRSLSDPSEPKDLEELVEEIRSLYGDGLLPGLTTPWAKEERQKVRIEYELALATAVAASGYSTFLSALPGSEPTDEGAGTTAKAWHTYERLKRIAQMYEMNKFSAERDYWRTAVRRSEDDIRSTVEWALDEGEHAIALEIAGGFWYYWRSAGKVAEGRRLVERALASAGDHVVPVIKARALEGAAVLAAQDGDIGIGMARIKQACELWEESGDSVSHARSVYNKALVHELAGDEETALNGTYHSLALHRFAGDSLYITKRLIDLCQAERLAGRPRLAMDHVNEALDRLGETATWIRGLALYQRAMTRMHLLENLDRESSSYAEIEGPSRVDSEEAIAAFEKLQDQRLLSHALRHLGILEHWRGDFAAARARYARAHQVALDSGDMGAAGNALRELGDLAADEGDREGAVALVKNSVILLESVGDPVGLNLSRQKLAELLEGEVDS